MAVNIVNSTKKMDTDIIEISNVGATSPSSLGHDSWPEDGSPKDSCEDSPTEDTDTQKSGLSSTSIYGLNLLLWFNTSLNQDFLNFPPLSLSGTEVKDWPVFLLREVWKWQGNSIGRDTAQASRDLSLQVFVGCLPTSWRHVDIQSQFQRFRPQFQWTRMEKSRRDRNHLNPGWMFMVLPSYKSLQELTESCRRYRKANGEVEFFFKTANGPEFQICVWSSTDNHHVTNKAIRVTVKNTVYVCGLNVQVSAKILATAMADMFGPVAHTSIFLNEVGYPNGRGRVTFMFQQSHKVATQATTASIQTPEFSRQIKIYPWRDNSYRPCWSSTSSSETESDSDSK